MSRCTAALLVPVPDEPDQTDRQIVAQCERDEHHPGAHRASPKLVWRAPVESNG